MFQDTFFLNSSKTNGKGGKKPPCLSVRYRVGRQGIHRIASQLFCAAYRINLDRDHSKSWEACNDLRRT
jgi:hypothetical protein